jgi:hypothetical protein
VPEHDGEDTAVELPIHDVEIGAADGAGRDPQHHLVFEGLGHRAFFRGEAGASLAEDHRPIGGSPNTLHRCR